MLTPPGRSNACSALRVWQGCLWPAAWGSDCQAPALQRASHRKPVLPKTVTSKASREVNVTLLWSFLRGKDLVFAIGFCSGKDIFSVSWQMYLLISFPPKLLSPFSLIPSSLIQIQSPTEYVPRDLCEEWEDYHMSSLPCCGSFCSLSFPCEFYIALFKPSLTGRSVEWSYHYPLLP